MFLIVHRDFVGIWMNIYTQRNVTYASGVIKHGWPELSSWKNRRSQRGDFPANQWGGSLIGPWPARQSVLNKCLWEYLRPGCGIALIFCVSPLHLGRGWDSTLHSGDPTTNPGQASASGIVRSIGSVTHVRAELILHVESHCRGTLWGGGFERWCCVSSCGCLRLQLVSFGVIQSFSLEDDNDQNLSHGCEARPREAHHVCQIVELGGATTASGTQKKMTWD